MTRRYVRGRQLAQLVAVVVVLALPVAAYAWGQTYAANTVFNNDGMATSGNNSGLNYNFVGWYNYFGTGVMQLTLCDTTPSCYTYAESSSGTLTDHRSISYGHAKCHLKTTPIAQVHITECHTDNTNGVD